MNIERPQYGKVVILFGSGFAMPCKDAVKEAFEKVMGLDSSRLMVLDPSLSERQISRKDTDLFVIPGGNAVFAAANLSRYSRFNDSLKAYNRNGGHGLYICAGAYLMAGKASFQWKNRRRGVMESPFGWNHKIEAIGFPYSSTLSQDRLYNARASALKVNQTISNSNVKSFWNLGPYFSCLDKSVKIIARYEDVEGEPAAIIESDGSVYTGTHPEFIYGVTSDNVFENHSTADELNKYTIQQTKLFKTICNHAGLSP